MHLNKRKEQCDLFFWGGWGVGGGKNSSKYKLQTRIIMTKGKTDRPRNSKYYIMFSTWLPVPSLPALGSMHSSTHLSSHTDLLCRTEQVTRAGVLAGQVTPFTHPHPSPTTTPPSPTHHHPYHPPPSLSSPCSQSSSSSPHLVFLSPRPALYVH